MLFILAMQRQRNQNIEKENQHWQTQLVKQTLQYQSNFLRESLLEEIKQMKRLIRRQERMTGFNSDIYCENIFENNNEINNEEDTFHFESEIGINNNRNNHNNESHHRRCKSKGINNLNLLNESKINDESFVKNENKNCAICLDDYKIGDKITYLPCFHLYHSKCIKKWLKCSKKCPLCKKVVKLKNK